MTDEQKLRAARLMRFARSLWPTPIAIETMLGAIIQTGLEQQDPRACFLDAIGVMNSAIEALDDFERSERS